MPLGFLTISSEVDVVGEGGKLRGVSHVHDLVQVSARNLGERLEHESFKMCLAGFGVGLTWSSIIMEIGHLKFNRIIEF